MKRNQKKRYYALSCMTAIAVVALFSSIGGFILRRTLLKDLVQYDNVADIAIPMLLIQDSSPLYEAQARAEWEATQHGINPQFASNDEMAPLNASSSALTATLTLSSSFPPKSTYKPVLTFQPEPTHVSVSSASSTVMHTSPLSSMSSTTITSEPATATAASRTSTPTPTLAVAHIPTATQTPVPTFAPVITYTAAPILVSTVKQTQVPVTIPAVTYTAAPTIVPPVKQTQVPAITPAVTYTTVPTLVPTVKETHVPATTPAVTYTAAPTIVPTVKQTQVPAITPAVTYTPASTHTPVPIFMPNPTPDPSPTNSGVITQPPFVITEHYFDRTLFIGDSKTDGLRMWGRLGDAQYFCGTSYSVYNIFKKQASDLTFEDAKLEDVLASNTYDQIYIILGYNEAGYDYNNLMDQFRYVIARIREAQPSARIILHAVMHASARVAKKISYYTVKHLEKINDGLKTIALEGDNMYYIDCNPPFCDENGFLLKHVSNDGEHLTPKYTAQWAQEIMARAIIN